MPRSSMRGPRWRLFRTGITSATSSCSRSRTPRRKQADRAATVGEELLPVEEGTEAGVAGTAYGELGAVVEHGDVAIFRVGLDSGDAFEIHDVRAVNAHEAGRIENRFEARDGLLLQVLFAFGAERNVIVL